MEKLELIEQLYKSLVSDDRKENDVKNFLESICQKDPDLMLDVIRQFEKRYNHTLDDVLIVLSMEEYFDVKRVIMFAQKLAGTFNH